ncbi:MAG: DUF4347 domain-containing protein [Proteobacteria bacterium]|nr:DUF4347 domain-containing protein [Pseudomonadota bacterium]MBU1687160.1 DUF4347 domain-containing protein [Pseudomonadota bacterium]
MKKMMKALSLAVFFVLVIGMGSAENIWAMVEMGADSFQSAQGSGGPAVADIGSPYPVEVLFVAADVTDADVLLNGLRPGVEVVRLDPTRDGLGQMAGTLKGRSGIDTIHIISHGSEGALHLGGLTLTAQNMGDHGTDLAIIGDALDANADILLYGCNVAKGEDGTAFVAALAQATGADIAASNDITGAAALGGNWVLETQIGLIAAHKAISDPPLLAYDHLLVLPNGVQNVTGTMANGTPTLASFVPAFTFTNTAGLNLANDPTPGFDGIYYSPNAGNGDFTVSADNTNVVVFDLTAINFTNFSTTANYSFTITGNKSGGGTVSTTFTATGQSFTSGSYTNFTGLTSFRVEFSGTNNTNPSNITFDTFTVANAALAAAPTITSATYDASTNSLVVTGTGLTATGGANNDINVAKLSLTGEAGGSYTLTSANVELTSATSFTVALNAADQTHVEGLLNKNGTSSTDSTTYNIAAAADWNPANAGNADLTGNGVTVSNVQTPTISSATYDASTGVLAVTGTNMVNASGATNDITANKFTLKGEGGATYTLTDTANVEIASATAFSFTLSATDKAAVNQMLNKNGTLSTGGATFSLDAADDWNTVITGGSIADAGNGITVSNVAAPAITSATYDAATSNLVVTGTGFLKLNGVGNDIVANKFTLTGEGGTYTLTDTANVEITSGTAFTLTLSATDQAGVNLYVNKNGTSSTSGTTYNLNAAEDWAAGADAAVNVVDATGNTITASNVAVPTIASATYDAATGSLVVTGTGFLSKSGGTNDIVANKFTITGEGVATYTLTDTANVEITSGTAFTLTLSATDQAGVNLYVNKNGTSSTSGTTYNLNAGEDWAAGADAAVNVVDATNGITASNVAVPTITSATYDASTGVLVVTGTGLLSKAGATNDIVANKFTITGAGSTYTLTDTANVEVASGTTFTLTLSATDRAALNLIVNKNGTSSTNTVAYNLNAGEDWAAGVDAAVNVVDATGNTITASNVAVPAITSATYDAAAGNLVVTGTGFLRKAGGTNDIVANTFSIAGEGGSYTLTDTANVEISSGTAFTLALSVTDKAALNQIVNKNGTSSTSATTYNLAAAEDWAAGADPAVVVADLTGNGITASNVAVPTVASATYNTSTGVLVVTGTGLLSLSGANNDIAVAKLTITGEGGATHALTSSANVDIASSTSFTVTLSGTDKAAVNQIMNKNGTTSTGGTTYNLEAAEDWAAGAAAAVVVLDSWNTITVSNVTAPTITSATYDYASNILTVTGTGFFPFAGATNDIDLSTFTITGEGGNTYTLITATDVEITSASQFAATLSGADLYNVERLLNKDGSSSDSGTTYNLAAADNWNRGADGAVDITDGTNAITVSNWTAPTITSATYDWATDQLAITGTNLVNTLGATNDLDASMVTITGEGGSYALTDTPDAELTNATTVTLTLSATDQLNVRGLLNKNGTLSSGAVTYNLAAADNWLPGTPATSDISDLTGNGITVSNVATPSITSATYDSDTGVLVVTGTNLFNKVGAANDIVLNKLTFTGQGGGGAAYTLTSASNVEITSATSFTVTLSGADKTNVDALLNQIGTSAADTTLYNLAAADDWLAAADPALNTADASNGITVFIAPKITSATYNAATGALVVTGTNMQAKAGVTNDITANKFTFTAEGGTTYTLTDSANVELTSATSFTISLSATDKAAINQTVNKNGIASTGGTTYNLAAADDWDANVTAGDTSDLTGNPITASNVAVPAITSATYDAATGNMVVTGTGFLKLTGAANDIVANRFTITGEGATHTLTDTANVEITSGTSFTLALSAADKAALNMIVNKNGTSSSSGTTYNLAAAEDWTAGADVAVVGADLAGNGITASNVAVPAITSATYDASTGNLVVTGTGLLSKAGGPNDIVANKFTITGEGGGTYTLTDTANVEITSGTAFTLALSATDKAALNLIVNKNGTASTSATTYNLAAAEDWATGADVAVVVADIVGNGITASNVAVPAITSATYDSNTNVLTVTGTGFLSKSGATNDIDISTLTFTGEGGATYVLTSASDVEITSSTQFSITLAGTDLTNVESLLNNNGTSSVGGTTYNLAAAEDWAAGADPALAVADLTGNAITVSNYAGPTITSATYDWSTGQLVISGANLVGNSGAANDLDASTLTVTGEGGSYALTDTSDVELTSSTSVTVTLSVTDQLNVHGLLNKNGTVSSSAITYNLAAADNWLPGAPAATNISDLTGNGITVSNVAVPTVTSAVYNTDTGAVTVTVTNLFSKIGAANDVDLSMFSFTGEGGGTYTLTTAADVEISAVTSFSFTLGGADKTQVDLLLNKPGTSANDATTYNIAAADNWLTAADAAIDISDAGPNAVTVIVNPKITSATYDYSTGTLVVTGTDIQANGSGSDLDASKLTITGQGGGTYTLTDTADVNRDSVSQFTLVLSATDKAAVDLLLNKSGTSSVDTTTYNLAAADDWNTAVIAGDSSDLTGNTITVSNVPATIIVTNTNDSGAGSLRQAIADAASGDTIDLTGISGTITLTTGELAINKSLTFTGPNTNSLVISGNSTSRVLNISGGTVVSLSYVTIQDGLVNFVDGAGILNAGTLSIDHSTIRENHGFMAGNGGGIANVGGTLTVTSCTLENDTSAGNGGGIYSNGTAIVTNSTLWGDSVNVDGGGIYSSGTLTLANNTISGNWAFSNNGGGIYNAGTLHLLNTITANSFGTDCFNTGTIATNTNNLIEDNTCSPALSGDPGLTALADHGGATQILGLLASSPVIDAGDNATCATTDQRDMARPVDGDFNASAICDIGAYEYSPGAVQFSSATYIVAENGGTATITVTRTGGTDGAVSVNYATTNGTATAGSDYTATTGTLNWADGDSGAKTFPVPIINDTAIEPSETVNLALNTFVGVAQGGQLAAQLTITDNDTPAPPPPVVSYTVTSSAGEHGTINPSSAVTVDQGDVVTFTLTPDAGYMVGGVTGTCGGTLNGTTYTTNSIYSNCRVEASFTLLAVIDSDNDGTPDDEDTFPEDPALFEPGIDQVGFRGSGDNSWDNIVGGNPKLDVDFTFETVINTPDAGSVWLVIDGFPQQMDCGPVPVDFSVPVTCTIDLNLGPAGSHSYHVEVREGNEYTGTLLSQTNEIAGPTIELLHGANMVGLARALLAGLDLTDLLGSERIYRWISGGLSTIGNNGSFEPCGTGCDHIPGLGYFMERQSLASLPDLSTYPAYSEPEFVIEVVPGWNLIANPYGGQVRLVDVLVQVDDGTPLPWLDAGAANLVVNGIYYYQGNDWGSLYGFESAGGDPDAMLIPWRGYWVYVVQEGGPYRLIIPKP